MTPPRKYTDVRVSPDINVSSSGHYFATVTYAVRGCKGRDERYYCLTEGFLSNNPGGGFWDAPQYLVLEAQKQIHGLMSNFQARYFEYDRDGNTRYTELRYYDDQHALWLMQILRVDMGGKPRW